MSCQIAFLIDSYVENKNTNQLSSLANAINLTGFRLLHYLSAKFEKKGLDRISKQSHTTVKWGYKFFNSTSCATRIEQHRFRDFKLKYFEEFENEVQRRLETQPQCLNLAVKKVRPSECLSKALTEILSDFPWERLDITSPIRGRKKKKESSLVKNIVILFARCPKSSSELKTFTGKRVPDSEVFLDSLLPPALFHQFCDVNQLSLYWIDIGVLNNNEEVVPELCAIKNIEEALLKAKGKVFPVSSVVQCRTPSFSNLATVGLVQGKEHGEADTESQPTLLLPYTTTLHSFLFSRNHHYRERENDNTAVLETGDRQNLVLKLEPLSENRLSGDSGDNKENLPSELNIESIDPSTTSTFKPRLFEVDRPILNPYAVLLPNDRFQFEKGETFLCSEFCQQGVEGYTRTGGLERIIEKLKVRNASLVLSCIQINQLVILEPLTAHTASLWLVPIGRQLWLEKQLLSQDNTVTSPELRDTLPDCDSLIQRLVASGQFKKSDGPVLPQERLASDFNPTLIDRWHVTGCAQNKIFSGLINKLNERLNELDFLTEAEAGALRQLQKAYRQENKPPGLRDTSLLSLNDSSQFNTTLDQLSQLDTSSRSNKNTSRQSVSRGELMYALAKSKDDVKGREGKEKEAGNVEGKKEKEKAVIAAQHCEFSSLEELQTYLTSMYERVLRREITSIDSTVQTMVTVVNNYMKQNQQEETQESCKDFLDKHVVVTGAKLREKYSQKSDDTDRQEKMVEYEFQVLLRLEMRSTLVNKDQTLGEEEANDEIVGLLRTLSFISEPGMLSKFMETKLLYNYVHTIPKTLANIYDELMQPLPDLLANQLSPDTSGDQSDLNSSLIGGDDIVGPPSAHTRSHGSAGPPSYSSQPGSNRSIGMDMIPNTQKGGRKLVHHPSLADFGAKRQIVVQKVTKPKEKSSKKRKRKPSGKSEKERISKRLFDGVRGGTKLERRQSVAVMERTHKTPKKSKSKVYLRSPKGMLSPRRKMVAETPCHKQVSQVLRRTPGKMKTQSSAVDEANDVVEESPEKQVKGTLLQDTPTKAKRAKALLRRSFYSAGPVKRTRNLTKYFQLADKIAGRQRHTSGNNSQHKLPKLISFEDPSKVQSPGKNSSFLLSQLMSSPSPRKRTPRKAVMSPSSGRRTPRRLGLHYPSPAKQEILASPLSARKTPRKLLATPSKTSPLSARKTPRKILATPNKSVTESPSMHTRSKLDGNFIVPSADALLSPVSRRQSPRVLVADSSTKRIVESPHRTPVKSPAVKSPVCGTITAGLDSPSQNTRTSATPTRKSVRAALFAKSPAIKTCNSSIGKLDVTGFQKKLISDLNQDDRPSANRNSDLKLERKLSANRNLSFMSPQKDNILSPRKVQNFSPAKGRSKSPTKGQSYKNVGLEFAEGPETLNGFITNIVKTETVKKSPEKMVTSGDKSTSNESCSINKCRALNFGLTPNSKQGPTIIQRTPSPTKKQKTKTPDSFDKWHRRKPRSCQSSPMTRKQSLEQGVIKTAEEKLVDMDVPVDLKNQKPIESESAETEPGPLRRISSSQNQSLNINRKRSLMQSPEKLYESPGKRQRISRTRSIRVESYSSQQHCGSQGFSITDSFSEFSQNSGVSSVDYLSASNDEVFLSQSNELLSQEDVEMIDIDIKGKVNNRTLAQSSKGWFSPRHKTLERITSGQFSPDRGQDQRSESPVFRSSKKSNRNRSISGENGKTHVDSEDVSVKTCSVNTRSPSSRASPRSGKSPGNKKYSPVVSAKSLMHLIQSPLLKSCGDDNNEEVNPKTCSPSNRRNIHGDRSRRSLKLQN